MTIKSKIIVFLCFLCFGIGLHAQKKETKVELQVQGAATQSEKVLKRKVAIVRFSNETQYGKGIFYDKNNDPMAKQAIDNLSNKLASTGKFMLFERSDLDKLESEGQLSGGYQKIGTDYVIVGSITEFGRKSVGNANLISRSKVQIAEAAVSLRLIDVSSGLIIYSEEAKGEAELKTKETLGVGSAAGYDATLSDKAISVAISKLVENVINNLMEKPWKAYFLAIDERDIFITGGKSQGLAVGDTFLVKEKGKTIKNPQTGLQMELPGKEVGKIRITFTGGETPESEFSLVEFIDGNINEANLSNYYIEEIKS